MAIDSQAPAPEWETIRWFGGPPQTLAGLRGKVVALEVFQLLCPGCVHHGLPQAQRISKTFDPEQVAVVGLHSVFEHHGAMGPEVLEAFLSENRITFPVGVDAPGEGSLPRTMERYGLQGTPSFLLYRRSGRLERVFFGQVDDLRLGAEIGRLMLLAD